MLYDSWCGNTSIIVHSSTDMSDRVLLIEPHHRHHKHIHQPQNKHNQHTWTIGHNHRVSTIRARVVGAFTCVHNNQSLQNERTTQNMEGLGISKSRCPPSFLTAHVVRSPRLVVIACGFGHVHMARASIQSTFQHLTVAHAAQHGATGGNDALSYPSFFRFRISCSWL